MSQAEKEIDPQLKRGKPTIPGYWSVEELATELGVTVRKIQYDIKGNPRLKTQSILKAYKIGPIFLVPEADAVEYIISQRRKSQKKFTNLNRKNVS
ncbi:MAG: hypothetical protein N5P05_004555 (plasmid) [Chroococcopsis gigantea SAG 12.99]|jgi:transcriptional antiterminator|nr:hypothetical protein [Chroococcopsis gigantea SAG 12.99]